MKAKSRRRLLISSVAMLLVAMLALGTATFAWFTQNTSATADGITVRTSKTSSLLISDDTRAYASSFVYQDVKTIMFPGSSIDGKNWFYTYAEAPDSFASGSNTITKVTDLTENKYVYVDQLNIQNSGDVDVNSVKITVSNFSTSAKYLNVALVPVNNKVTGGDTTMTAEQFRANIYTDAATAKAYNPISATGTLQSATSITPTGQNTTSFDIAVGTIAGHGEKHYNLFVWFEGQDEDCKDANAGLGINNLTFTVTGTPATES